MYFMLENHENRIKYPKIIFYNTVVKYKDNYFFIFYSFKYHMKRYYLENAALYYLKGTLFFYAKLNFP
jgi:hypothetical protein